MVESVYKNMGPYLETLSETVLFFRCVKWLLQSILKYLNNLLRPQEIKREMINDKFSSLQKKSLY